jgi:hypothetical protein
MKRRVTTILDAIRDPVLFAPWFRKRESWASWFAFLSALFALPMTPEQLALYQRCTGRTTAPAVPFVESWLICGRRSGKSFMLALIAVFLACFYNWAPYLAPGERGTVLVIATDRRQSRVILRYIRALLTGVPMLKQLIESEVREGFDLTNGITIETAVASYKTVRGYTVVCSLLDEIAFWPTDDAAEPDTEILNALRPAMSTVPGAMLLCASSPYSRRGALYQTWRQHFGQDNSDVLVWQADTRTMNPTVSQATIAKAYDDDPAKAGAEYGAQFRSDVEGFVSAEVVAAATIPGRFELPPSSGVNYCAFVDPSGGAHDAMTLAIAHLDYASGHAVVDLLREVRPPFSPESTVEAFCKTLARYNVSTVRGDRYGGEWPRERFLVHGVTYELSEMSKSDLYQALLPRLNSGLVELLEHQRLSAQLCCLERRVARGGKDSIDHPPGGHDDVANVVAGAVDLALSGTAAVMNITPDILRQASIRPAYMQQRHHANHQHRMRRRGGLLP